MKVRGMIGCVLLSAGVAGCGMWSDDDGSSGGGGLNVAGPTGCVQGVVVDGKTGERVKLPKSKRKKRTGIFALVRGHLVSADIPVNPKKATDKEGNRESQKLDGEYTLCGVPLDEKFPLMAWVDGYAQFQGHVEISSRNRHEFKKNVNEDGEEVTEAELTERDMPTELANIRLYRLGEHAKDLKFNVTYDGQAVKNAGVRMVPAGEETKLTASGEHFLEPSIARTSAITVNTNDKGEALVPADKLVLGGLYEYRVVPPSGGVAYDGANGSIRVGSVADFDRAQGHALTREPFSVLVDLDSSTSDLQLLATSADESRENPSGALTLIFNRPVKVYPGTADQIGATLLNSVFAELEENTPNNGAPEQVKVEANGSRVTLKPVFKDGAKPDESLEPGISIIYEGLQVRPKNGPNSAEGTLVSDMLTDGQLPRVFLYGGQTPATAAALTSSFAGRDLSFQQEGETVTITAKVWDQGRQWVENGSVRTTPPQGLGNVPVTVTVGGETETGFVGTEPGEEKKTITVTSSSVSGQEGTVEFTWTFGAADRQSLVIEGPYAQIEPIEVTATKR